MTNGLKYFLILGFAISLEAANAADSSALRAKRKRSDRATVDVKRVKRKKSKTKKAARPQYNQAAVLVNTKEKKLIKGIDKTLSFLNRTVKQLPKKSGARLQMLERVLNLTLEQSAYIGSGEQEYYDQRWRKWSRTGRKGPEPKLNNSKSNSHWRRVYSLSKSILKEYPKAQQSDNIAFNGALALVFLGRESAASKEFLKIIKLYPKSSFAGDSYFSLGDYYFDRNDFGTAANYYRSAIKYRRSKRFGWALFKLGWCYYNLGQFNRSLDSWKKTVLHSDKMEGGKGLRLKEEAMRDMIFSFAELKKIDEAIRFYKRNGGEQHIAKLLKLLAETFTEQGKFKQSIRAWKRLLSLYPYSKEAFDGQTEIVSLNFEDGNIKAVWNELEKLTNNYNTRSAWASKNERSIVKDAQESIKDLLLYYPKVIHKDAQKTNSKATFNEAKKGYMLFIKRYPKGKEIPEVKEYLGDIDYFQGNYREAGQTYLSIALLGKNKTLVFNDKGKLKANIHKRSAENMLDSYNKDFLPELKALLKLKPDFRKPPRALTVRASNFIKGCNYYMKWYPGDKKTVKNCETFMSEIYFRSQNKKLAVKYLWLIAKKYPTQKEGRVAVDHLIPIFQNKPKELAATARKLLSIPAYRKGKIGKKLNDLLRGMQLEQISSEKSDLKRAKLYEAQAKKFPKDTDADKFWNNAAVDYLKAANFNGAMNAFAMIVKLYPKSKLYGSSILQLGKLYDDVLDFGQASNYFLLFANKYPKQKEAAGAMQRACELQIALGSNKAVNTCTNFSKRYPAGGAFAIEKLIDSLWKSRQYSTMTKVIFSNYIQKFKLTANQKILAYYKVYKAYNAKGSQAQKALQGINRTARGGRGISGEALRYIGEIAFLGVQGLQKQFSRYRLQGGNVDKLQASIEMITGKLNQLEQAYGSVFSTQDSYWGIAAFYQLGFSYESFAGLLKSPPSINGVKREDLIKQLQASVDQIEAKAKEYYTTGLQTTRRFTVYNSWSVKIFNGLNRIVKRKVSFEELVVSPDFIGSEVPDKVRTQLK